MHNFEIVNDELFTINESCSVILNNHLVKIEYNFIDCDATVLVFNNCDSDVCLIENGLIQNSRVKILYLQLDSHNFKQETSILVKNESNLIVNTTYLGINDKDIVFDLFNDGSDSSIDIVNNIVCLKDSNFSLDCIGSIKKGSKRSKCHQKSNCLTIEKPKKARVLPVLNIDENDVEASHSLSSGTIDSEVMFYMNSRGLSKNEALKLILQSYLMPNDDYYLPFSNGEYIKNIAIKKVENICLI